MSFYGGPLTTAPDTTDLRRRIDSDEGVVHLLTDHRSSHGQQSFPGEEVVEGIHRRFNGTVSAGESVPCSSGLFFFLVYGPIYGIVCGFGLIGNTLSFATMHKYSKDTVPNFLLKALAVMDNVFLATAAFVSMYPAMEMHLGHMDQLVSIFNSFQALAWPLTHIVQLGTVWMMVLVAANRYIAICRPLHAARLCSKRNVKRQIAAVVALVFLYNIPRFLEYRYFYVSETSPIDNVTREVEMNEGLASYPLYNILYENIAYCLFVYLIPLSILVVFNVQLILELKRARRCRPRLVGRKSSEENNITLVMIIIIISFIICETPASINQILFYLIDDHQKQTCSTYMRYSHISNLMITTNSSLNFAIYCLFRRQFREELVALLCRQQRIGRNKTGCRRTVILRAVHQNSCGSDTNMTMGSERILYELHPVRLDKLDK